MVWSEREESRHGEISVVSYAAWDDNRNYAH
jgi:hypothetical protein